MEVYCGEKANKIYGTYMPEETFEALREFVVSIKGPLTTPVGGGIRSLNVALRQNWICMYVCVLCVGSKASLHLFNILS